MEQYVIGCDIGSQGVKSSLVSAAGKIVAEAGAGYAIDYPYPTWAEQNADCWITAMCESVQSALKQAQVKPGQVRAIGLDAQVDGMVAVDPSGKPLRPAILWLDRRATSQIEKAAERCDPKQVFQITGLNFDPYHVAPKIRWLADHHPDLFEQARYFLLPGSYVARYLTGEVGVDYSNASSTLLMDVRQRMWSSDLCDCFEIPMEKLAPIYPADHIIGGLRATIADSLGLLKDTPVILGCGDEHAACLGAGVIEDGLVADIAGTAEPVCAAALQPVFDETGLVETHCHGHPEQWLIENPGFVSGANYRWFRDQFARDITNQALLQQIDVYELLNEGAAKAPPGADGLVFLPTLMGSVTPTWNSDMRGAFLGFSLSHGWEHFVRALLEGSAYALRDITDRMQAVGLGIKEIRAVGGGARGALWRQIKADVTGLPVSLLQTTETTSLGAAMLALCGAGLVDSLEDAVEKMVNVVETRQPDASIQAHYEDCYQQYREAYFTLLPYFEQKAKKEK